MENWYGGEDMLQVGIMVHSRRQEAMEYASRVAMFLKQRGVRVFAEEIVANKLSVEPFAQAENMDALISLGGDGTLLRGAQYALKWNAALLGINLGRVGFLTEIEPQEIEGSLTALINGEYTIETRALLSITLEGEKWYALNDVVLSRGSSARLTTINAWVDG